MYTLIDEDTDMVVDSFYDRIKAEQTLAYLVLEQGARIRVEVGKPTAMLHKTSFCLDGLDDLIRNQRKLQ